jgi:curved DNA-binding protein CbpA
MDYYTILGVPRDADEAAIRNAFHLLVRRYHPDSGAGSNSEKFREVVAAYETLGDPVRRRGYDLSLPAAEALLPVPVEPLKARAASATHGVLSDLLSEFEDDDRLFVRWG